MQSEEGEEEWREKEDEEDPRGLFSMPGNIWVSVGQREAGSWSPPRHWRTKAKQARARGSVVRSRIIREEKLGWALAEEKAAGLREALSPAIGEIAPATKRSGETKGLSGDTDNGGFFSLKNFF